MVNIRRNNEELNCFVSMLHSLCSTEIITIIHFSQNLTVSLELIIVQLDDNVD